MARTAGYRHPANRHRPTQWMLVTLLAGAFSAGAADRPFDVRPEVATLTQAPFAPPAIGRRVPTRVTVRLEAREVTREIAPGLTYPCRTIGGHVPGPMIRVLEGDTIEVEFGNHPDNKQAYQITFHAASGDAGTATSPETPPGQLSRFSFQAVHSGLFLYQAGGTNHAEDVASGMFGLMLVEPTYGFRPADREYYLIQSEFYPAGRRDGQGLQAFSLDKAVAENPEFVVFNGSENGLQGENALVADEGDLVRLFVGNAGPNLASSFHIEGVVLDNVYYEGGTAIYFNVPTTLIPAGGTAIIELNMASAGDYALVDQALFRSVYKGARGWLKVNNPAGPSDHPPAPELTGYTPPPDPVSPAGGAAAKTPQFQEKIKKGEQVFNRTCIACHQATGQGIPNLYPPLAQSDYLLANVEDAIAGAIKGRLGEITVNGKKFNMLMPPQMLNDEDLANVITYVLNSWGNNGGEVTGEKVKEVRDRIK